ncbi:ANK-REP-REGION domain-containing protein [Mycena sanguinolenta]|uniref:ANK-REP-REGION domain-containing protein n=1 Tax=Mycena sanguinolenta TaxID=230812 RepID=A0A8H6YTF9_9AGAR|nr:ANK-REP-REGION domain-containing protein [Mycena sanguinolenta]
MADLVGLIASVLQLVDTVAKARDYIQDFRDAPKDQQRLLQELDALKPLIAKLDRLAKQSSMGAGSEMLREWEEPLEQLETIMRRLARKANLNGIQQFSSRLTWAMWGKDDVQQALNAVERYKGLFNTWLALDTWTLGQGMIPAGPRESTDTARNRTDHEHIIESLTRLFIPISSVCFCTLTPWTRTVGVRDFGIINLWLPDISQSLRNVVRNQEQQHNSTKRNEIITWFSPLNFFPRQADLFNARQPGTGGWLLENPAFKKWELGTIRTVWCRGIPGAGKTILSAMVVDHLRKSRDSANTRVAVVFLNHKETEAQSPSNILAAIWRQLVFEQPLSPSVEGLYSKCQEQRTRPSLDDIHSALCSIAAALSRVLIVVDGLDEYPEDPRIVLLYRLSGLGPQVGVMLTSRPHIDIKHVIPNFETIEIQAAENDIREYLEGQIRKSQRLSRHLRSAPDIRQALEASIVKGSDGMFLLAKLHIDSLLTKHTVKAIREALKNMPGDLDGTYAEVVARINDQTTDDKTLAWLILSWMTHAKRPLRPTELKEALAVESGAAELDPENFLDMDSILSVCAGLVVIHEEDDIIGLVHYTVQTYLEQLAAVEFPHASTEITMTCITYLSFEGFLDKLNKDNPLTLSKNYSFLDYAVEYCFVHARGDPEEQIRDEILAFLENCSFWRELWNRTKFPTISAARLWIAATFQLENLCRYLIEEDGPGTVLLEASSKGHTNVVQILLPNTSQSEHGHGLVAAAGRGHDEIIQLFLGHGTRINFCTRDGITALQSAAFHGCKRTIDLLVDNGADIDMIGSRYGTALRAASLRGHYDVVVLLLEHGADIDARGGLTGTALQAAFSAGREAIVRLLFNNGADDPDALMRILLQNALSAMNELAVVGIMDELNKRSELDPIWVSTLIQAASPQEKGILIRSFIHLGLHLLVRQHKNVLTEILQVISEKADNAEMIQLLLAHGADPNAAGAGGSILQRVAAAGHEEIVKILLEHGADVGRLGASAVSCALRAGHTEIARLLLNHGAEMDATHDVLSWASAAGHTEVVKLLIEHGADVNAADGILWRASRAGHNELVKLFIEHGADVNAVQGPDGSAVKSAIQRGHAEVVKSLIEHGADMDAAAGLLDMASAAGHARIVKLLIEHGANANAAGVLRAGLTAGHTQVVKLLLEHGVNVNAGDAFSVAAAAGHEEIVKLLLEYGADVNAGSDTDAGGALQQASEAGHARLVKILVEHGAEVNAGGFYRSALRRALAAGHAEVVILLIDLGADMYAAPVEEALRSASAAGHEKIVEILLEHGVEVNARSNSNTGTALHWALEAGHENIVKILLEHGAKVDAGNNSNAGTALCRASETGHEKIVEILLEHGVDVNAGKNSKAGTALHRASELGHERIVKILLKHGAEIDERRNSYAGTALHRALEAGHEKIVKILLEHGAKVGTALHWASELGHERIVEILIEHGAEVNAGSNSNAGTALHRASEAGHEKIVKILLEHSAEVDAGSNFYAGTALHRASEAGHENIVKILLEHGAKVDAGSNSLADTALHRASQARQAKIVKTLLEHGADINALGRWGYYCLERSKDTQVCRNHRVTYRARCH